MEIQTSRVEIPLAGGGSMGGYLARPTGAGPFPGVVVFMEIFGINSHIRDVTERVAREGYVAIAPDYFHRTGPGAEYGYDDDGFAKGMELLNRTPSKAIADEVSAVVEAGLKGLPVKRLWVRVIQPGRSRMVGVHVQLPSDHSLTLAQLDEVRAQTATALRERYQPLTLDMIFIGDEYWGGGQAGAASDHGSGGQR